MCRKFNYIIILLVFLLSTLISPNTIASELHDAAKSGNYKRVKELIVDGADLDELAPEPQSGQDWPKGTALHWAAPAGHEDIVRLLIENSAYVNEETDFGDCTIVDTPLDFAVWKKHKGIVLILLKSGANVESVGHNHSWPLERALRNGSIDIAQILLDHGADMDREGVGGYTSLHQSIDNNQKVSIAFLLKNGADVNSCWDDFCIAPIHIAAKEGNTDIINMLIQYGANLRLKSSDGKTPLMIANNYGNKKAAIILKKHLKIQSNQNKITNIASIRMNHFHYAHDTKTWKLNASSSLKSKDRKSYTVEMLEDKNNKTAWVEGVKGHGISEYITYQFLGQSEKVPFSSYNQVWLNGFIIVNGYGKNKKIWKNNSRLKKVRIDHNDNPLHYIDLQDSINPQKVVFNSIAVFPEDESIIILSFVSSPDAMPSIIILYAGLSFTEPPGLNHSALANSSTPGLISS